jgi:hypothetical protein
VLRGTCAYALHLFRAATAKTAENEVTLLALEKGEFMQMLVMRGAEGSIGRSGSSDKILGEEGAMDNRQ